MPASLHIAAAGDLHASDALADRLHRAFAGLDGQVELVLLAGDLTTHRLPEQASILADACSEVDVPVVAVLGNHDYHSGQEREVCRILGEAGVKLLDGEACEVHGIGFAGAKGFLGGYGRGTLGAWGEAAIKRFVQEAIDEAM